MLLLLFARRMVLGLGVVTQERTPTVCCSNRLSAVSASCSLREALELVLVFVDDGTLRGRQYRVLHLGLRGQVPVEVGKVILDAGHVGWRDLLRQ